MFQYVPNKLTIEALDLCLTVRIATPWNITAQEMAAPYTATAKQNPGRRAWLVEFRHPLRLDANNKPGRKTRKGLGTTDPVRAQELTRQLSKLLENETLWSIGAREEAAKLFDPEVIDIFYGEIEPRTTDARAIRDRLLPLPEARAGYAKVVLVGVPGAGKTTLIRQLLGADPKSEAFPSTSPNRTTMYPSEFVLRPGQFEAVVTFMTEHETRFEVEESVSAAISEAADQDAKRVARAFLEKSDLRFRLDCILGDLEIAQDEPDPYADDAPDSEHGVVGAEVREVASHDRQRNAEFVRACVERIFSIQQKYAQPVEAEFGSLDTLALTDRIAALDLIEEQATASDEFVALVSDILDELRGKFEPLQAVGRLDKTTTGWPRAWVMKCKPEERKALLGSLRYFSGISYRWWGELLTPLVNGIRVQGPFKPRWTDEEPRLVLMDAEGLGHKANPSVDLPEHTVAALHEADVILLVDSAKTGMTHGAAGKALESIANAGCTRKLAVAFTHMDLASSPEFKGQQLLDHVFLGMRNIVDNELAKNVSPDATRFLLSRLEHHTFFLGNIHKADAKGAARELNRLLSHLTAAQPAVRRPVAFPRYSEAHLMLVIQEAARDFRAQWHGLLGMAQDPSFKPRAWQIIKALTRRYAENWGEDFELRPTANLRTALETAVSRLLEAPIEWAGEASPEQKRDAIERLKSIVTAKLPELTRKRLRERPQSAWRDAWTPRGIGSTKTRNIRIEGIFERWVPIPNARSDKTDIEFLNEIEEIVRAALKDFEDEVAGQAISALDTDAIRAA